MGETTQDITKQVEEAIASAEVLESLVGNLAGASRRSRQISASVLARIAKERAELLTPYVNDFIDALNRPEAQTRWESLDVLTALVEHDSRGCEKAIPGAETALFDEESGPVRLAALRFLCRLGATTENRSEKLWPLVDEGIQCYHGDYEFQDMLIAVIDFSLGKPSASVKKALKERMAFDAENAKGMLKRRAQQIIDNVS